MPNWSDSMQQTFEFYTVDPGTWKDMKRLDIVKACSIKRDLESETLGSASMDVTESLGECYVRVNETLALFFSIVRSGLSGFPGGVLLMLKVCSVDHPLGFQYNSSFPPTLCVVA